MKLNLAVSHSVEVWSRTNKATKTDSICSEMYFVLSQAHESRLTKTVLFKGHFTLQASAGLLS